MPWDASLNQDVHESVRRHCILSRAALRILHPSTGCSPSPHRINEDIEGVWKSMEIVRQHRGVYVPGLAERTGRRYQKTQAVTEQRGGPRTKGDPSIAHMKQITTMHCDLFICPSSMPSTNPSSIPSSSKERCIVAVCNTY